MKIIPLINEITNSFNEIFKKNLNPLNLENKIRDVSDLFTLKLYESFLNYFNDQFKNKKERKMKYNIKETRKKTLITSVGVITVNSTSYIDKETKEYYIPLRDILHLKPYQRLTNEAEYQLTGNQITLNGEAITSYKNIESSIKDLITQKKIQLSLRAFEEDYVETLKKQKELKDEIDRITQKATMHTEWYENALKGTGDT